MDRVILSAISLADYLDRSRLHRLADALDGAMVSKRKLHLMETVARLLEEVRARYEARDPTIDLPQAEWFLQHYDNAHKFTPNGQIGDHWAKANLEGILAGDDDDYEFEEESEEPSPPQTPQGR